MLHTTRPFLYTSLSTLHTTRPFLYTSLSTLHTTRPFLYTNLSTLHITSSLLYTILLNSLVPRLFPKKKRGRKEPGNIHRKSCRLPLPCSGGTNQIAERNHMYTRHFVHSAKNCQLENELISVDYTLKVGEKQFSDVRMRRKSRESNIKVCCSWFVGPTRSPYFAALSLHVQSVSRNSAQLQMP